MITPAAIANVLQTVTITHANEDELQAALAAVLSGAGVDCKREVRLSDGRSRIDLIAKYSPGAVGWLGIEVKIKGSTADVVRQLTRYAACPELSELILVTTRAKHHQVPRVLNNKAVHLVSLVEAGL